MENFLKPIRDIGINSIGIIITMIGFLLMWFCFTLDRDRIIPYIILIIGIVVVIIGFIFMIMYR